MSEAVVLNEQPKADQIYMIVGWRQWADAGATSSGLPQYLIQQLNARQIGSIKPDGFYLFQIPGTHDLVRPVVKFDDGYAQSLKTQRNEIFYAEDNGRGLVIFLGDEPHMDVERYSNAILHIAETLGVKRVISLGGVYGELPYDKERMISSSYSLRHLKEELDGLAVNFSDYHGGASIGSYICRRAGERDIEMVGLYAFVPTYDFSNMAQLGNTIRIENDFMAWLGIMRRVNYMLKTRIDLSDLEQKSKRLIELVESKVDELDSVAPQLGVREYLTQLSDAFTETPFDPLDEVWEDELRRLFDVDDLDPTE
jgi:proteasome assembly chaperone (PAC2) family protein